MKKWRVTVNLTHPEEVVADSATLEENGALTFRNDDGSFVSCYAPGAWRKLEITKEAKKNEIPTDGADNGSQEAS